MLETFKKSKNSTKSSNQEYHVKMVRDLIQDGIFLQNIPNFNSDFYYQRENGKGWWMPMKQLVIRSYIRQYLKILGPREYIKLNFIDPLASYGMNKLTKENFKDTFIFPGTALNAALISLRSERGFDKFYLNDRDSNVRQVILNRFNALSKFSKNAINFDIEPFEKSKVDSNKWLIDVLNQINEDRVSNYLIVIDNQGMDIGYETLKKIRNINQFGDVIITFHDTVFSRALNFSEKNKFFFGTNVDRESTIKERRDLYISQLRKIGFGRIEPIHVRSESSFFYTLLFCCRDNVSGDWLRMIKYFREERYKNCTDKYLKNIYDVAARKIKSIDEWCKV